MIDVQTNNDKTHILIYPNQSMSFHAYWLMFSVLASITMIIAVVLAYQGTWVIVPFAALHLLFVWWGFKKAYQSSENVQYITIDSKNTYFGSSLEGLINKFQTSWLRVEMINDTKKHDEPKLYLKLHNKRTVIASCLVKEEKYELMEILQEKLTRLK